MKGWIKLHRKLQDCWIWLDSEPYDKRSAWVDLLLAANHSDSKILFDGEFKVVKRGQILTSVRSLAARWRWSKEKVRRYISLLEDDGMLFKENDMNRTLLTIANYELYQCRNDEGNNTDESSEADTPIQGGDSTESSASPPETPPKKKPKKSERTVYYPNDEALDRAFADFVDMRKKIRKPMTERAISLAMKKLLELAPLPFGDGLDNDLAIKVLEQSTMNCWQGLFPLNDDRRSSNIRGSTSGRSQLDDLLEQIRKDEADD